MRIAIIDDDEIQHMLVKAVVLSECGNNVICDSFFNGKQSLEYLKKLADTKQPFPDMVFLDIFMPIMNGWELLDQIKATPQLMPVLSRTFMLSSSINVNDYEKAKRYGVFYIEKPLERLVFRHVLKRVTV